MSSVIIAGNTSGSVTLAAPDVAGTTTLTLPATSGTVMVNGPAFSAYMNSNMTLTSSTWTKLNFDTEIFDTNSNYDTSAYKFTPTVAGYYLINVQVFFLTGRYTSGASAIYKNGSAYKQSVLSAYITDDLNDFTVLTSALVYMNGSTDYIEAYGFLSGTSTNITASSTYSNFDACLIRGA